MILKTYIRGGGAKRAYYLLDNKKNDQSYILEIKGTASPESLYDSMAEMSAYEKLTRSHKGFVEIVVNPATGREMSREEWLRASQVIRDSIGLSEQPQAAVIHQYKGEEHMHLVVGRFDPDTETMLGVDHIALKLKQARLQLEKEQGHQHLLSWQEKKAAEKQAMEREAVDRQQEMENAEDIKADDLRLEVADAEKKRQRKKMHEMLLSSADIQKTMTLEEQELEDKLTIERARMVKRHAAILSDQVALSKLDGDLEGASAAVKRQLERDIAAQQEQFRRDHQVMDEDHDSRRVQLINDQAAGQEILPSLSKIPEKLLHEEHELPEKTGLQPKNENAVIPNQSEAEAAQEEIAAIALEHRKQENAYHFQPVDSTDFHEPVDHVTKRNNQEQHEALSKKLEQERQQRIEKIMHNAEKNKNLTALQLSRLKYEQNKQATVEIENETQLAKSRRLYEQKKKLEEEQNP